MKRKIRECDKEKKEIIKRDIVDEINKHSGILFAYLHGSFVACKRFSDIDVAIYLREVPDTILDYELDMEIALGNAVDGIPVDVRILNGAPLSFRYNVVKSGVPLVVKDDDERAEFQERTVAHYFDFAPFRALYLKEAFGLAV